MRITTTAFFYALIFLIAAPLAAKAQDQVWTSLTAKISPTKRWDFATSLEHRWQYGELNRFADLRLTRDARKNWAWWYEYRAPLVQTVNPRHTLALENTWKPRLNGVKLLDAIGGVRYHFNRAASVRYGLYLQRSFGTLTPELSAEHWLETFMPTSDLRRTRYAVGMNWDASKRLRWSASWAFQKDYTGLGVLEEDFSVLRLGLRCKL